MANGQILDIVEMYEVESTHQIVIFFAQQIDDEASGLRFLPTTQKCIDCTARVLFGCKGPAIVSSVLTYLELPMGRTNARLNMAVIPPGYFKTCLENMGIPDLETST